MPTYEQFKRGYRNMWNKCSVKSGRDEQLALAAAEDIIENRTRYATISEATGVPWWWIGAVHYRESSFNFEAHLHNGDPLSARTVRVPSGRPKEGEPPFIFEESAIDALKLRKLHEVGEWVLERALFEWEAYNGFGYVSQRVNSPYVWAGTNHEQKGLYVRDHVFDRDQEDNRVGCAAILKMLVEISPDVRRDIGEAEAPVPVPPMEPVAPPVESGVVTVIEDFANKAHAAIVAMTPLAGADHRRVKLDLDVVVGGYIVKLDLTIEREA